MRALSWILPVIVLAAAAPRQARAEFVVNSIELVQTVPVETDLEPMGLRAAVEVWPQMLADAKKSIDIAMFYVAPKQGEPLDAALAALKAAGKRGVKIRFLAEAKLSKVSELGFALLKEIPNLELRVIEFSEVKQDGILHAKYFVVDGQEAFVGSQNFDWRALKHIHELGLRIMDPYVVKQVAAVFEHDWEAHHTLGEGEEVARTNRTLPQGDTGRPAYLVVSPWSHNPEGVGDSESELVRLIGRANKDLAIELLDYKPLAHLKNLFYSPIDNALRAAAARGVKVKLMVSHWNTEEPGIDHLKSLSLLPNVDVRIVTIPEAKEGFIPFARVIHAKYMVVDGELLWLGTSNWAGGYLDNSRNLEVVVVDAKMAAKVRDIHRQLWESEYAEPVDVGKTYPKPRK